MGRYRTGKVISWSLWNALSPGALGSSHEMLRLSRGPVLDIIHQLIGEELHRSIGCPGDVRRQNEIGTPDVEQRMAVLGRFDREHVESGAGNQPFVERPDQSAFVDQPTA